jgi:hypothetical protein
LGQETEEFKEFKEFKEYEEFKEGTLVKSRSLVRALFLANPSFFHAELLGLLGLLELLPCRNRSTTGPTSVTDTRHSYG